jgi:hypothetical protein
MKAVWSIAFVLINLFAFKDKVAVVKGAELKLSSLLLSCPLSTVKMFAKYKIFV